MPYVEQYTANFTNEQGNDVVVSILQKDGTAPVSVENYPVLSLSVSSNSDSQDSYACIISKELSITLWTTDTDAITWETFTTSAHDEWKIIVTVDGTTFFIGFLTPDEGSAPFQDKPYEINLKATDGLGLLKGYELTNTDESKFRGFYTLIQYIAGALDKTALDLPIRIYSTLFHASMLNKGDSLDYDLFQEVELNGRTFLKDVNSYESCYEALKILFDGWCSIEQYEGKWQIVVLSERQYIPGSRYYVDYDFDGTNPVGAIDATGKGQVGKNELIYPINENQIISSLFANKQVKHTYKYIVPDDLVDNQNLQQLGDFIAPLSGSGYSAYELVHWTHYKGQPQTGLPTSETPSSQTAYIKQEVDAYGTQTDRYYVVPHDATAPSTQLENYIRNDNIDFFVDEGDYLSISITYRTSADENTTDLFLASLIILKDGMSGSSTGHWYSLDDTAGWINSPNSVFGQYNIVDDTTQWKTVSLDNLLIPASGTAYLLLGHGDMVVAGNEAHFKDIKITYTPYLRGARFTLKGDYHLRSQTANFPDKYEKEMLISDSPKRIIKGSMFWTNATPERILLDPTFYRYPNTTESFNFKELANLGKFNKTYRRFYRIEGEFTSLFYNTATDEALRKPLGFHNAYTFTDITPNRDFVLIPSMEMDLLTGNVKCVFVEVYKDSADGTTNGDVDRFDYIF